MVEMVTLSWTFCLCPQADSHHSEAHACIPQTGQCAVDLPLPGGCVASNTEKPAHHWPAMDGFAPNWASPDAAEHDLGNRDCPGVRNCSGRDAKWVEPGVPSCCIFQAAEK